MKLKILLLTILTLGAMTVHAQKITGDWKGMLSIPQANMELELIFHITGEGANLSTTMDVPAQGATGIPVEKTSFADGKLTLSAASLQFTFKGTLQCRADGLQPAAYATTIRIQIARQYSLAFDRRRA